MFYGFQTSTVHAPPPALARGTTAVHELSDAVRVLSLTAPCVVNPLSRRAQDRIVPSVLRSIFSSYGF